MEVKINSDAFMFGSKCYLKQIHCRRCKKEGFVYNIQILDHVMKIYPDGWCFDNYVSDDNKIRYVAYCDDCAQQFILAIKSYKGESYED